MVSLSGSILVFRDSLETVFYPKIYNLTVKDSYLNIDSIIKSSTQSLKSTIKWNYFEIPDQKYRPILFSYRHNKKHDYLAINPYTGEILSNSINTDSFFPFILSVHRHLSLGKIGKTITGISAILFLSLLITGLILFIKKSSSGNLYYKIHSLSGIFIYPVAIIIVLTGLLFAYKDLRYGIYDILDSGNKTTKNKVYANSQVSNIDYQKILNQAIIELPAPLGTLRIYPPDKHGIITIRENKYSGKTQYVRNILYFDSNSKLIDKQLFNTSSTAEKFDRILYPIHTGTILSKFSKWLYLIVTLVIITLPISGIIMYLRRKKLYPKGDKKLN